MAYLVEVLVLCTFHILKLLLVLAHLFFDKFLHILVGLELISEMSEHKSHKLIVEEIALRLRVVAMGHFPYQPHTL